MAPSLPPAPHGLPVRVDATLRPLIPGFLRRVRADIVGCRIALTAGRLSHLRALCHKNTGCCAMYGFVDLSQHFAALERCMTDAKAVNRQVARIPRAETKNRAATAAMTALERYAARLHITYQ